MNNDITPKQRGINTELHCISYFSDCGFLVSTPYGDNGRYDLIVDVNGHLLRVQVKTASGVYDSEGKLMAIKFSCKSARINTKESYTRQYTKKEIDYFATYWNGRVFVVPVGESNSEKTLHIYCSDNHCRTASFIDDYTVDRQWGGFLDNSSQFCEPFMREPEVSWTDFTYKRGKSQYVRKCEKCGKQISSTAKRCAECAYTLSRRVDRPDRETLKHLIRTNSFTELGRQFGVSGNAISKWCKLYGLPHRVQDIRSISDSDWENF